MQHKKWRHVCLSSGCMHMSSLQCRGEQKILVGTTFQLLSTKNQPER